MKNILNTIVLLEIISVMCVRHTASFKNNYRGRPITKLFNTPQKNDNDSETPVGVTQVKCNASKYARVSNLMHQSRQV